jgi:CMP-N-acetylneuraminic acid synthetase/regulator of RNase E activity RraA
MKVIAFLPAKGQSDRVTNKNTRTFNGEPFFVFTLRKLLKCDFIDEVYIDSESDEILRIGERIGARPLKRDPALASNRTDGHELFYNEISQVPADIYIQHLCTSPFIKEQTLRRCVETLQRDNSYDSVVLAKSDKYYHWKDGRPAYDISHIPNSVDLPDEVSEAMGLYVVRGEAARRTRRRIADRPCLIMGDPLELIDVNTEEDFRLAATIGAGIVADEEKRLRVIGRFLSSPLLSDICDELGIRCVLGPDYSGNFVGARIFGRARTLHIRAATDSDAPDSIYKALQSYRHIVSNDVIVVRNDLPHFAYFGELNMSLAIRSGAIGAVVGGVTRDSFATSRAAFPVFSKGNYCRDIKGRGAVQSINQPIDLDGVMIEPSDLVFADQDGIVVIPSRHEEQVLASALTKLMAENSILSDVCADIAVDGLVEKYGFF